MILAFMAMAYGRVLWSLKRQKHDPFTVEGSVDAGSPTGERIKARAC
jgi:hypothetical protein